LPIVVSLTACSSGDKATASGDDEVRIAYFAPVQNGFVQTSMDGAKAAAKKFGGTIETVFAANGDLTLQQNQIQDAIASRKYDAILVYPLAPQVAPSLTAAVEAGLQVAVVENSINAENPLKAASLPGLAAVTTEELADRVDALVKMTVDACDGLDPCEVAYIRGIQQNPSDVAIFDGYEEGLQSHTEIEIVGTGEGRYQVGPAQTAAQDLLQAHPDIDVFASNADIMTQGAALAGKGAGKDDIKFIGVGASEQGCAAVKAGEWFGTTNSVPYAAGYDAAKAVIEAVGGSELSDPIVNPLEAAGLPLSSTKSTADECPGQWGI
jgi:ribose transport system substrate-binding protein